MKPFGPSSKNLLPNLGVLATLLVLGQISYFDPGMVLFRDDHVFVAERVFFPSMWDWVVHVVLFCQRRFTHLGDAFLFRPGTFFYTWLVDLFFRSDRLFLTQLSAAL